jgi:hypothetical protein
MKQQFESFADYYLPQMHKIVAVSVAVIRDAVAAAIKAIIIDCCTPSVIPKIVGCIGKAVKDKVIFCFCLFVVGVVGDDVFFVGLVGVAIANDGGGGVDADTLGGEDDRAAKR